MSDDVYCYPPDYKVLINKYELRDADQLEYFERESATQRAAQGVPSGDFDLTHLKAIHFHLFQDVYEWAGKIRMVEIAKGGSQFQFRQYIETGMADVHKRLVARNYLKDLSAPDFAKEASEIIGDINYVHPFREGNGRTQMLYMRQLSEQAGHEINLSLIRRNDWMRASIDAHGGNYQRMEDCIFKAIAPVHARGRGEISPSQNPGHGHSHDDDHEPEH